MSVLGRLASSDESGKIYMLMTCRGDGAVVGRTRRVISYKKKSECLSRKESVKI